MYLPKKIKNGLFASVAVSGIIFAFLTGIAFLERGESFDCKISSWDINATLEEDGDLHIVDTIEFKSDGYHFFEYEIGYGKNIVQGSGTQSYFDYDSIQVSVYNQKNHYYFKNQSKATSNSSDYYKYDDCLGFSWNENDRENDGVKLNYYTSGKSRELIYVYLDDGLDSTIYFKYEYTIKNALNKYDDISELNWQFATPLEEMGVNDISLTLNLPEVCSLYNCITSWEEEGIMAFGHGNGNSKITTFTNTKIETTTSKLESYIGDVLELRLVIPNDPYDAFDKVSEENKISSSITGKEILQNEEERLTKLDQAITNEYNSKLALFITGNILGIVLLFIIMLLVYFKFDKERKPIFDSEYLREPPSKIMPSFLSYLMNEKEITTESFTSNIISLIRKKYLLVDSNHSVLTDEKANYIISKNNSESVNEPLNSDEEFLMDLLFNKMFAQTNSFTLSELEKKLKIESSAQIYINAINSWRKTSKKRASKLNYYDKIQGVKSFSILGLAGLLFAIYSIFSLYFTYYMPILSSILPSLVIGVSVFFINYIDSINRKSKIGIEEYAKWLAFKKFLSDFSHFEDYDVMSVIIWEEYLVYANVLGIADLVEKQMRIKLKDQPAEVNNTMSDTESFFFLLHMNRVSRRMTFYCNLANQTVIAAKAARAAKTAGKVAGSGGFGGSSSHGGGGHGGRAG